MNVIKRLYNVWQTKKFLGGALEVFKHVPLCDHEALELNFFQLWGMSNMHTVAFVSLIKPSKPFGVLSLRDKLSTSSGSSLNSIHDGAYLQV